MGKDHIVSKLKTFLVQNLKPELDVDQIRDDERLMAGGLDLDSIAIVELISFVEEGFDFQFQDTDLRPSTFETLASLTDTIAERIGC